MVHPWNPDLYQQQHSFVWQLSADLVAVLNPQPGEHIVDLGCGTGQLTAAIAAQAATVIGLDADPAMIAEAQQNFPHLTFQVADARTFTVPQAVDAVFSNAALHWIPAAATVAAQIGQALKPGGRLVAEFGGQGNVGTIRAAIAQARQDLGFGPSAAFAWYFPSIGEYAQVLESQGFEVRYATLYDRPTPLATEQGMRDWLRMFASRFWMDLTVEQQAELLTAIEAATRSTLYRDGQWWADYRRLRVVAVKPA